MRSGTRVLLAGLLLAACSRGGIDEQDGLTVFAAASLTEAFTELGEAFSATEPDSEVTFNFASSSDLVTQLNEGAAANVFASADQANMAKLVGARSASGEPRVFATNILQIITEPGNPEHIVDVTDLADPDLIVVTCAPQVPIGRYTADVFTKAGVEVRPDSLEEDVKGILTKVALGEADAGIVYATDVRAAGERVTGVEIPPELNVRAEYPIVVTSEAGNEAAEGFVEFVLSPTGQDILASHGFGQP